MSAEDNILPFTGRHVDDGPIPGDVLRACREELAAIIEQLAPCIEDENERFIIDDRDSNEPIMLDVGTYYRIIRALGLLSLEILGIEQRFGGAA